MSAHLNASFERTWTRTNLYIPRAQLHVAHAITRPLTGTDYERIREKARRGHIEHNGSITRYGPLDYLINVVEELDDALFYVAHWEANHGSVGLLYEAS